MSSMAQMLMIWTLRSSAGSVEYFSLTLIVAACAPGPPGGAPSPSTAPAASANGHGSVRGGRARSLPRRGPGLPLRPPPSASRAPHPVRPPCRATRPTPFLKDISALRPLRARAAAAGQIFRRNLNTGRNYYVPAGPLQVLFLSGEGAPWIFLRVAKVSYLGGNFLQPPP